jgi:hypothetical protein
VTIQSRPYKPDSNKCCQACAFGTGKHAEFCESKALTKLLADAMGRERAAARRKREERYAEFVRDGVPEVLSRLDV